MLDWIIITLALVSLIPLLTEFRVRWFSRKRKDPHIYEQLAKTVNRIANDAHKDEELSAVRKRLKKFSGTGQSDKRISRIEQTVPSI